MKLARYGPAGQERPAVVDGDGHLRDLSAHVGDVCGDTITPDSLAELAALEPDSLPHVEGEPRIGPCVGSVGKFLCIGLNYSDHAAETGAVVPPEPVLFMKPTSAIGGPNDDVRMPRGSRKTGWEVELGGGIGSSAKNVIRRLCAWHIPCYCVLNEGSEREFQFQPHCPWDKGKGCDPFGPIGPWLVTPDEVGDPGN